MASHVRARLWKWTADEIKVSIYLHRPNFRRRSWLTVCFSFGAFKSVEKRRETINSRKKSPRLRYAWWHFKCVTFWCFHTFSSRSVLKPWILSWCSWLFIYWVTFTVMSQVYHQDKRSVIRHSRCGDFCWRGVRRWKLLSVSVRCTSTHACIHVEMSLCSHPPERLLSNITEFPIGIPKNIPVDMFITVMAGQENRWVLPLFLLVLTLSNGGEIWVDRNLPSVCRSSINTLNGQLSEVCHFLAPMMFFFASAGTWASC